MWCRLKETSLLAKWCLQRSLDAVIYSTGLYVKVECQNDAFVYCRTIEWLGLEGLKDHLVPMQNHCAKC